MKKAVFFLLFSLMSWSCSSGGDKVPDFEHRELYLDLQACAEKFLFEEGEWVEDFDDGAFYGPAFYARAGKTEGKQAYSEMAAEAHARNLELVDGANLLTGDVNMIVMAALGMVEYIGATGDTGGLEALDALVVALMDLVDSFGFYVEPELVPGYAMETYGPTAINGLMVLLPLQRALIIEGGDTSAMIEFAEKVTGNIDERSYNSEYYEFYDGEQRPGLFLYPNITMIILNSRLYQLTGDKRYLNRALDTYSGMQPLRVTPESGLSGPGRYRSPYSAEHMGAQTENYSTLSSQNYLMLALMLLYQVTGEVAYLEEVSPVLDFIDNFLRGTSCRSDIHMATCEPACGEQEACLKGKCYEDACYCGILHHWMDEQVAVPEDPEYFCSGCNLQLLYIMWYRQFAL